MSLNIDLKLTYRVAKMELNTLFYSPVAWLVLLIFVCQVGYNFSSSFGALIYSQDMGRSIWSVSNQVFGTYITGVTPPILKYIYLYIPLVTMGLMSREYMSGSIKLLYSSPIKNSSIILGKFLAMSIYGFALIAILIIYALFSYMCVDNFDYPMVLISILGLYLLILSYCAIGLFMSTLTQYQVIAAVGTLVTLAILNNIGSVGQNISFIKEVTYWLELSGRAEMFLEGLLSSEDTIYFIIVISLFISLSVFKLNSEKKYMSFKVKIFKYSAIVLVFLILGYITTLPQIKFYYDGTYTKANTLSEESQDVVESLNGGLTITTYVNLLEANFSRSIPVNHNIDRERWSKYIRFKPEIKMEYVYYYDKAYNPALSNEYAGLTEEEKAKKLCKLYNLDFDMFLSPEEIKKVIDLKPEKNKYIRVVERESGAKTILRMFNDSSKEPLEAEISTALITLSVKSPIVAFASGNNFRNINNTGSKGLYLVASDKWNRNALPNLGFTAISIDLDSDELEDIDILVLADLNESLSETIKVKINKYIENGGNLFILGEYGRNQNINQIIKPLGVEFMPGILVQNSLSTMPYILQTYLTKEASDNFPEYANMRRMGYSVIMPTTTAIDYSKVKEFEVLPILKTTSSAWIEYDAIDLIDGEFKYNPELGEKQTEYPTLIALKRKVGNKYQRIIISGDTDCIANEELTTSRSDVESSNISITKASFRWFSNNILPVNIENIEAIDSKISLPNGSSLFLSIVSIVILPLLLLLFGVALIVRRHRK